MPTYVNFTRNALPYFQGDSKAEGYDGWVEALSVQFRPAPPRQEPDPGKESAPSGGAVVIAKLLDSATPRIAVAFHAGTEMDINFALVKSNSYDKSLSYTATDAIITQVLTTSDGDRTTETITIDFKKIVVGYVVDGPDVSDHLPAEVIGYNLLPHAPL